MINMSTTRHFVYAPISDSLEQLYFGVAQTSDCSVQLAFPQLAVFTIFGILAGTRLLLRLRDRDATTK